jgi:hypothetical protein
VLRRIFGPKREEVSGSWRRLRNEELHNLYASPDIIIFTIIIIIIIIVVVVVKEIESRRMSWAGHVRNGRDEKCIHSFGWKT